MTTEDRCMIVETDNFGGDYPDESFLLGFSLPRQEANTIASAINKVLPDDYPRYWKVVPVGYKLAPGFEP